MSVYEMHVSITNALHDCADADDFGIYISTLDNR